MKTIGLIAGNGRFPLLVAKEAHEAGYRIVTCCIEGEADHALTKMSDIFQWIKIGEIKKVSKFFRAEGVHEAVMAGKVEKVKLLQENVKLDFDMVKVLMKLKDHKDDSLLAGISDYLHSQGVDILDSTFLMKNYLPGPGILGKKKISKQGMVNVEFGYKMAKHIAAADIGQTVIVKNKTVVAVESVEGTDRAIRRAGDLVNGKVTVVKVAKPHQDMRFDVPAVGLKTLESLVHAGAEIFAFEAGKTLFLDRNLFVERANKAGISLIGLDPEKYEDAI